MIIKYGSDLLDLNTINSVDDITKFANEIKGQKTSVIPAHKDRGKSDKEILFDELTEKEIAINNLVYVLENEHSRLKDKMFPVSVCEVVAFASRMKQQKMVEIPPVDSELFANLQKISYIAIFLKSYLNTLIQARVGFGLVLSIDSKGKIFILSDLKELYKRA